MSEDDLKRQAQALVVLTQAGLDRRAAITQHEISMLIATKEARFLELEAEIRVYDMKVEAYRVEMGIVDDEDVDKEVFPVVDIDDVLHKGRKK